MPALHTIDLMLHSSRMYGGLIAGATGGAAWLALDNLAGRAPERAAPGLRAGSGASLAAAVFGAVAAAVRTPLSVILLGVAAAAISGLRRPGRAVDLVLVVGVWAALAGVTLSDSRIHSWFSLTALAALVALGGPVTATFDRTGQPVWVEMAALALTAGGMWVCLPNTEAAETALGASATALLATGLRRERRGCGPAPAVLVVLGWVIVYGTQGREAATSGAAACLGVLVLAPFATIILSEWDRRLSPAWIICVQLVVVLAASRWSGLMHNPRESFAAAVLVLAVGSALLLAGPLLAGARQRRELW